MAGKCLVNRVSQPLFQRCIASCYVLSASVISHRLYAFSSRSECRRVVDELPVVDVTAASSMPFDREDRGHVWPATSAADAGMNRLACTAERWTYGYLPTADDDQQTLSCVATVPGLKPVIQSVRLDVDCT